MKKRTKISTACIVYVAVWAVILLVCVGAKLGYSDPAVEPLDAFMTQGVYNVFILVSCAGLFSAALLPLSLRTRAAKSGGIEKTAFALSIATNALFYTSAVLIFLKNSNIVIIAPIAWAVSFVCCALTLVVPWVKKSGGKNAPKVAAFVFSIVCLASVLSSCDGKTISGNLNLYKYSADFKSYTSDFNKVKDHILKTYSGADEKWFSVSTTAEKGRTLYDPDVDLYINLPSDVKESLEVISKYGFPNKDSNLDTIVIRDGRVSFFIELNIYALVYSSNGRPTYLASPDENKDILVKSIGDGWYHVIVK